MTSSRCFAASVVLAAVALSSGVGSASAVGQARYLTPAVTVEQCEEGGGWVAANIATRQLFCTDGKFKDHLVS
ncbi:hypothetical protein ACIF6L_32010 [Kitasatospora sp. NPDC086009]|uniref:hypothetical protein n=1 Tax=unclassified Kitasatospora TaxID=2633591 RepID=UPI0037CA3AF6